MKKLIVFTAFIGCFTISLWGQGATPQVCGGTGVVIMSDSSVTISSWKFWSVNTPNTTIPSVKTPVENTFPTRITFDENLPDELDIRINTSTGVKIIKLGSLRK